MAIWFVSSIGVTLLPFLLFIKGRDWRQKPWYLLVWVPIAVFAMVPVIVALGHDGPSNSRSEGPGDGVPIMIPFICGWVLAWSLSIVAVVIHRPRCWNRGAFFAGIVVAYAALSLLRMGRTEVIELDLSRPDGSPRGRQKFEYTGVNLIGEITVATATTDEKGRRRIRVPRAESFRLGVTSAAVGPVPDGSPFRDTSLFVGREFGAYPDIRLSTSWRISPGGTFDVIHQSVILNLPRETKITRIPWIFGQESQAFAIDLSKAWKGVWPNGRFEDRTWRRLIDFPSIIAPFQGEPLPDSCDPLIGAAADLAEIESVRQRIGPASSDSAEGATVAVSEWFSRALCQSLLGSDPLDHAERSRLLGDFVAQRARQLMELIRPWMGKNDRWAFSVVREMGSLARPLTVEYPAVYPLLDESGRRDLRWTLWEVGPDPETVLFLLDDPDERVASGFFDAFRSPARPRALLERDLEVFHGWVAENPEKFTESMRDRLKSAIGERERQR